VPAKAGARSVTKSQDGASLAWHLLVPNWEPRARSMRRSNERFFSTATEYFEEPGVSERGMPSPEGGPFLSIAAAAVLFWN